ncbi:MAG TPA: AAA family ATPase [Spirillospora sp.]|nr:AAA family ATPase [Spirillospora sp.]
MDDRRAATPGGDDHREGRRTTRTAPPLEREREIAALRSAVRSAREGTGTVVLVQGPPGTGKTSLLAVAADIGHRTGLAVLAARGRELEREIALGVAVDLLAAPVTAAAPPERARLLSGPAAQAGPLFDTAADTGHQAADTGHQATDPGHQAADTGHQAADTGHQAADAILRGLCHLVAHLTGRNLPAARPRPTLLLVDDAQWADAASLRFLAMLADRIDRLPLAMVIATRDGEECSDAAVPRRLAAHPDARVLALVPLTAGAVARLVSAAFPEADGELAAAVAHASGGNPFFVTELLRSLEAAGAAGTPTAGAVAGMVPGTVLHSVLARLALLSADAGRLATAVAVLGDGTPLRRAAAHAELGLEAAERAADALAAARLLEPGNPLSFTHPLIGAAVHADQPAFTRSRQHRRAADLLAADGEGADRVAGHLMAVEPEGDPGVAGVLRGAAGRALRRGDPSAAARLLARAAAEPPPAELRAETLIELARAQAVAGDLDARATIARALDLLHGVPAARARALGLLAGIRHGCGDVPGAVAAHEEALSLLDPRTPRWQDELADYLVITSFHPSLRRQAGRRLRPVLDDARRGHPPSSPGLLAHVALWLALAGDPPPLVRKAAGAALAAETPVRLADHGALLGLVLHALVIAGELTAAEEAAGAAMATARRRGNTPAHAFAGYHRALARFHQGALPEALADLETARGPHAVGWTLAGGWIGWLLARVLIELGDRPGADKALAMVDEQPAQSMEAGLAMHVRAQLALSEGRPAAALEAAHAAGRHLRQIYDIDHPGLLPWRTTAALAAHRLGDHRQAQRLSEQALDRARAVEVTRDLGVALRVAGMVARPHRDIGLLKQAAATLSRVPATLEYARTLVALGSALRRDGQRTACAQPLRQGLDLAERMHARPLAERARAELHTIGRRPRRTAVTGIDALTPAERRVALLALNGLSNRQIADDLFITTKTVETHLAHAYRKLAIGNRRQLQDAFATRSP